MNFQEKILKKQDFRNKFKYIRANLTVDEKTKKDLYIQESLYSLKEYRDADYILSYVSRENEPDTKGFIKRAFLDGKKIAVPRCNNADVGMEFFLINAFEDLEKGHFGILEPKSDNKETFIKSKYSLCIVPGLGFDGRGHRIGYGAGYYDRYLNSFEGITVGLCYDACFVERLPIGGFDVRVNMVITEKKIVNVEW